MFGLGVQNEAGKRLTEFYQENTLVIANTLFQQPKRWLYTRTSPDDQHQNQTDYILRSQKWSSIQLLKTLGFPDGSADKKSTCNAGDKGDMGSIPGLGRSPREGNGDPLQYSCPENPMDRAAWQVTVHGVTKSGTHLSSPLVLCWLFAQMSTQDLQPTSFPVPWELRQELARQTLQFSNSTRRCRYQRQTPTCT